MVADASTTMTIDNVCIRPNSTSEVMSYERENLMPELTEEVSEVRAGRLRTGDTTGYEYVITAG